MGIWTVIRVAVLLCLFMVWQGPVVNGTALPEPSSVKDILDFLGALRKSKVKSKVVSLVNKNFKVYLKPSMPWGKGFSKKVAHCLYEVHVLRSKLLKDPKDLGKYSDIDLSGDVESVASVIIRYLPILHSEMWYLCFLASTECNNIGGGLLANQALRDGKDHPNILNQWFTDNVFKDPIPSIPKGFCNGDLHESNVGEIVASSAGVYRLHGIFLGGPLSRAQYGLFLVAQRWHNSNLGSAILFLQEFCRVVIKRKCDKHISPSKHETIRQLCESLTKGIDDLSLYIHPLHLRSLTMNPYKDKLRPGLFTNYVIWLQQNVTKIIKAFKKMLSESGDWTVDNLNELKSSGPFKYGFVFDTDSKWFDDIECFHLSVRSAIEALTSPGYGSLTSILKCLGD